MSRNFYILIIVLAVLIIATYYFMSEYKIRNEQKQTEGEEEKFFTLSEIIKTI